MKGVITREDEKGKITERKPKIIFTELQPLSDKEQLDLPFAASSDDDE